MRSLLSSLLLIPALTAPPFGGVQPQQEQPVSSSLSSGAQTTKASEHATSAQALHTVTTASGDREATLGLLDGQRLVAPRGAHAGSELSIIDASGNLVETLPARVKINDLGGVAKFEYRVVDEQHVAVTEQQSGPVSRVMHPPFGQRVAQAFQDPSSVDAALQASDAPQLGAVGSILATAALAGS